MALAPSRSSLTDEQLLLIDATRDFARDELLACDRRWDVDESSVAEVLPKLSEMGLLALCIPESAGGLGATYQVYAALIHELAVYSPSTAVTVAVHNMVGRIIHKFAPEPLRSQRLKEWGSAESFGAFALSEANAGSDASGIRATAKRVPGGYRINGEKMWITNGMRARWLFTTVRVEGASREESLCSFLVDGNEKGIERTKITGKLGIRGSETAVVHYHDVFVPEAHMIGKAGQGLAVSLPSLNEGRVGIAAQATGIAEACLMEMTSYARTREQFGRPIGKFQAVAGMIADSVVEMEAARALVWRAATSIDSGHADRSACSMAKLYASEAANRMAYRAVQIHGGAGYVRDCRVEQLFRDARITTIYEGTSEIQRMVIARELGAVA